MHHFANARSRFVQGLVGACLALLASAGGAATLSLSCPGSLDTAKDASGNVTVTCSSTSGTPGAAPVCSPFASPSTITPGQSALLNAGCSDATGWTWSVGGSPVSSSSSFSVSPGATTTYSVVASGPGGTSVAKTLTVTVSATSPPSTGGGTCGTLPVVDMGAVQMTGARFESRGFGGNEILIASLTVPAVSSNLSYIAIFEFSSSIVSRKVWVSKTRCDLSAAYPYYGAGTGPNIYFTVGGSMAGAMTFVPGETWYIHVKNENRNGTSSCTAGTCDIGMKIYPPN